VVDVSKQPGSTFDARLNACLAKVSANGGTCDARQDSGGAVAASIAESQSNITVLLPTVPVTFGAGLSWTVSGNDDLVMCQARQNIVLDFSQNGNATDITLSGVGDSIAHCGLKGSLLNSGTGPSIQLGSTTATGATDDIAVDNYVLWAGAVGVSMANCTRCFAAGNRVQQSGTNGIQANAVNGGIATDDWILDNELDDTNNCVGCVANASNGEINVLANTGLGALQNVTIRGNHIHNSNPNNAGQGGGAASCPISNITNNGTTWTVTCSVAMQIWTGQNMVIQASVSTLCSVSTCYNGTFVVASVGGTSGQNNTTFTITNSGTATYSSGGTAIWGTCSAVQTGGHNQYDTGCREGIQVSKTVYNVHIIDNDLLHVNSEGIVVSIGPAVIIGNVENQIGENAPGVGCILFGATNAPLMSSVVIKGNTCNDAPYAVYISIGFNQSINQILSQLDIEGNTAGVITGYPVLGIGLQMKNVGPAGSTITALSCSAGTCTETQTHNLTANCAAGQTWSIRNVTGSTNVPTYNGDFVISSPTNDGTGCTGFTFSGSQTGTAAFAAGAIAYPSQFVNSAIIQGNDWAAASTPMSIWSSTNIPSGFLDIWGNKESALPQTWQDVAGPEPNYAGTAAGPLVHRITSGHRMQFTGASGALGAQVVLSYTTGSTQLVGGYILWSIEAEDATGANSCELSGMTTYGGVNNLGVFVTQIQTTAQSTAACTSGDSLAATWTATGGSGLVKVNVNPNVSFAPLGTYRMFYEVHNLGLIDPTYLTNPVSMK
jgi:hypothetical protein